jgi:hypothetical protein
MDGHIAFALMQQMATAWRLLAYGRVAPAVLL